MPSRTMRPCAAGNCGALVVNGYCATHKARSESRPCAADRGYDHIWRKFRTYVIARFPICLDCGWQPSTDVHHVVKVRDNPALRLVLSNVKALCHSCHSKRTATGE